MSFPPTRGAAPGCLPSTSCTGAWLICSTSSTQRTEELRQVILTRTRWDGPEDSATSGVSSVAKSRYAVKHMAAAAVRGVLRGVEVAELTAEAKVAVCTASVGTP